jgi:protein involved in polysaccharide export with SLBB domain
MVTNHRNVRRLAGFIAGLMLTLSGCAILETPPAAATKSSAFAWLTQWTSQPLDVAPAFDLESLRPELRPAVVVPDDLLEVTIWDLYEPGKPHTFPVRVSAQQTIDTPFLGAFPVADRTAAQVETALAEGFRTAELLVSPRVLIRSLDPPTVKVQVGGAVQRTGFVELSRTDASVYAAIVSAGGLKKTASAQVGILRRVRPTDGGTALSVSHTDGSESPAIEMGPAAARNEHPQQRANSLEILSVATARPVTADSESTVNTIETAPRTDGGPPPSERMRHDARPPTWYDLTRLEDRQALRMMQLGEGDEVIVKAAASPVRIAGVVQRPGAYPLPTGRTLDVWQALELGGGVNHRDVPLNITLIRPAAEGRAARKWLLSVDNYDQHPVASPFVEPGDVLHVEPTAGSKLKRAAQDLWNKQ